MSMLNIVACVCQWINPTFAWLAIIQINQSPLTFHRLISRRSSIPRLQLGLNKGKDGLHSPTPQLMIIRLCRVLLCWLHYSMTSKQIIDSIPFGPISASSMLVYRQSSDWFCLPLRTLAILHRLVVWRLEPIILSSSKKTLFERSREIHLPQNLTCVTRRCTFTSLYGMFGVIEGGYPVPGSQRAKLWYVHGEFWSLLEQSI